ncbi:hypothetical protein CORC01_13742 [Colletotrichum orchidophilum]|uniref:DUF7704 domain-containing protein n=1 Tax=Colletotrichum orchidophilum TaxID=1209926 RepID=A0A1G4APE3_9PEZI|nr:uncharacterized protein CORC01_13742 [Colletotrichum orchidophilum]OHE90965.1 hypothetical protein CORC01_13742 [Colletotrichum orchidophilum]
MPSQIPKTYHILFTLLDPLIALWGTSIFLLSPSTATSSYLPSLEPPTYDPSKSHPASYTSSTSPFHPTPNTPAATALQSYSLPLHAQIAGHLLSNALLSALLLRATHDLKIWRIYQLALLIVDASLLYGTFASYALQGRLANPLSTWRLEDWGALSITLLAGLTRAAFLFGVGFPAKERTVKNKAG